MTTSKKEPPYEWNYAWKSRVFAFCWCFEVTQCQNKPKKLLIASPWLPLPLKTSSSPAPCIPRAPFWSNTKGQLPFTNVLQSDTKKTLLELAVYDAWNSSRINEMRSDYKLTKVINKIWLLKENPFLTVALMNYLPLYFDQSITMRMSTSFSPLQPFYFCGR